MPFGSGFWIEVFMISFWFIFGASPWLALALMRSLNFLFWEKHFVSHGATISEIASTRLWGVHPICVFVDSAPTPMSGWPWAQLGAGKKPDLNHALPHPGLQFIPSPGPALRK